MAIFAAPINANAQGMALSQFCATVTCEIIDITGTATSINQISMQIKYCKDGNLKVALGRQLSYIDGVVYIALYGVNSVTPASPETTSYDVVVRNTTGGSTFAKARVSQGANVTSSPDPSLNQNIKAAICGNDMF